MKNAPATTALELANEMERLVMKQAPQLHAEQITRICLDASRMVLKILPRKCWERDVQHCMVSIFEKRLDQMREWEHLFQAGTD